MSVRHYEGIGLRDRELVDKNAYYGDQLAGVVADLYFGKANAKIEGVLLRHLHKKKPIHRNHVGFDGERYCIDIQPKESDWDPKGSTVKFSTLKGREVFAGPGWKIGRLDFLDIDTDTWSVISLDVWVEHGLVLRDIASYERLPEDRQAYSFKHVYKDVYSFRPGKIVEEMKDSEKARFLTESGDSTIRGLGEAISKVIFPARGMTISDSGTITFPIDPNEVEEITIQMIKNGAMKTEAGRRNVIRQVFHEYYERRSSTE